MSNDQTVFEQAIAEVKSLAEQPDDQTKLQLYALYKQATQGDVRGNKPGLFDFVGAAKYEAWEKLRGMRPEDARQRYVELVRQLGGSC